MTISTHRFVEALYDSETGTTLVRHPEKENAWVDVTIVRDVIKGCPTASVSGEDDCEILSHLSHGKRSSLSERPKQLRLSITLAGHPKERR